MIILYTLIALIVVDAFGYWIHRALHQPWTGRLNKAHMTHHLVLYPPGKFTSDSYLDAGKDNTTWTFLALGAPLLLSPFGLWLLGVFGLGTAIWLFVVLSSYGLANVYIHDWFHLNSHWSQLLPGNHRLVNLHEEHHDDMSKNYGIFTFFWDRLMGTFKNVK